MSGTIEARDLYLRYTDAKGKSHIKEHRVYGDGFFDAQILEHAKVGTQVQLATKQEYRDAHWPRRA